MRVNIRKALLSGAAIAAVFCAAGTTWAQDKSNDAPQTITVTGSRVRSTFTTPTPVTVITTQQLQKAAPGNLVEAVNQLPQFYNSTTDSAPSAFFTSPGVGNFNLRSLGPQRTLTLLDGRRVVSSTAFGSTDSNTFPKEMIKSVEAVTGGASAAYGTDAIAGVVNFLLDTSFTGVRGHLQGGITSRGDNKNWEGSIAAGTDIGDKIHVLASFEQYEEQPIYTYKGRDWYKSYGLITNNTGSGPTYLVRPHVVSTSASLDGIFTIAGTEYQFNPDGSYSPFNAVPVGQGTLTTGNQAYVQPPGGSGTDIGADRPTIQPQTDRQSLFGYAEYKPMDNLKFFVQGIYGKNDAAQTNIGGSLTQGSVATIYSGNAFLPASLQTLLTNTGAASFAFNKLGSILDTAQNAFTISQNRMASVTSGFKYEFLRDGLFGGNWFRNWNANGYYQWGDTSFNMLQRGGFRVDRIQMALDAVKDAGGNTVCRVNLPQFVAVNGGKYSACQPINLFGRGHASPAAIDWVTGYDPGQTIGPTGIVYTTGAKGTDFYTTLASGDKVTSGYIWQNVTEITLDGDVWEGWGAGAISGAVGYSYRTEYLNQVVRVPDSPSNDLNTIRPVPPNDSTTCVVGVSCTGLRGSTAGNLNNSVAVQFSKVPNEKGGLFTGEFFGETLIPVFADLPFVKLLTVDGAARRAEYSGSGQIWAWKYGFSWDVLGGIRLRGAESRDVRAGTISDRYNQTGGLATVMDPCSTCATLGGKVVPVGTPGSTPPANQNPSPFLVSGGNPNIQPERGDTNTVGIVYQPTWLSNLSLSVDYYDIRLNGAIAAFTPQQIVDGCFAGSADLCARIIRLDPSQGTNGIGQGRINIVNATVLNLNRNRVSGLDAQIDYHTDVDWFGGDESVALSLFASNLEKYEISTTQTNGTEKTVNYAGTIFDTPPAAGPAYPRWKWNLNATYTRGPLSIFIQERFIDHVLLGRNVNGVNLSVDNNQVKPAYYTDMNIDYKLHRFGGDWDMFLNVSNLLDFDPPVVAAWNTALSPASSQTLPATYDVLGRRFTGGVRFNF